MIRWSAGDTFLIQQRILHVLFVFKFTFLCKHQDIAPAIFKMERTLVNGFLSLPFREHLSFQCLESQQI